MGLGLGLGVWWTRKEKKGKRMENGESGESSKMFQIEISIQCLKD